MNITADAVKQLRERTGAGMMECKKALVETKGDLDAAAELMRKQGLAKADKKAARVAAEGVIVLARSHDHKSAAMVEVNCETDFVAREHDFRAFAQSVAEAALATHATDLAALAAARLAGGESVEERRRALVAKIGENIAISRFQRYDAPNGNLLATYIHPGAQLGVMVELSGVTANDETREVAKDVAMQVAAVNPEFISRNDVTEAALAKEKDIARARALAEGKPEKVVDRIVEGRMAKYYEEVCLLDQPFIKENSMSIDQLLKQKAGANATVTRFARFKVGETQQDTPAAE